MFPVIDGAAKTLGRGGNGIAGAARNMFHLCTTEGVVLQVVVATATRALTVNRVLSVFAHDVVNIFFVHYARPQFFVVQAEGAGAFFSNARVVFVAHAALRVFFSRQ